jgi:Spy/CpxP family protein refolding chaperone
VVGGAANLAARTQAKGGAIYNNRGWDLVDASKEKDFDLAKIPKEQLPAELQNLTPEQQKQFIATKDKERGALQKQIGELGRKREEFVQAELKKNNVNLDQALDEQILRTIRNQATNRGFKF